MQQGRTGPHLTSMEPQPHTIACHPYSTSASLQLEATPDTCQCCSLTSSNSRHLLALRPHLAGGQALCIDLHRRAARAHAALGINTQLHQAIN